MGDISAEPSMEDILSSIKRIIAEEGDSAVASRTRRVSRPAVPRTSPEAFGHEEILELSDPLRAVDAAPPEAAPAPVAPAAPRAAPAPAPVASSILSAQTAEASRGPLDQLSRLVVKPEVAGSDTLEALVRELLRPMLRDWLDANLPTMIETMVAREIERITGQ